MDIIERLPNGLDTTLARWFADGVELSVGEWQKLALARAFVSDAPVVILDEPTASLDAIAEAELFERFRELMHGRTTVLISHRLASVRNADRICVLADGAIVEQGSHEELLGNGGLYAEMFTAQASRYR